MATVPFYFGVPFGAANTGRAATMQYQIVDNGGTGTTRQAFTGTGVTEDASDPGYYLTPAVNVDTAWVYPLKINWQDTGVASLRATELLNKGPVLEALALPAAAPGTLGGLDLPVLHGGTMQAGSTSTTAVLAAGASATNKAYDNCTLQIVSGTGAGQRRPIAYYNGGTKTATMKGAWLVTPDNTSVYIVRADDVPFLDASGDLAQTGSAANAASNPPAAATITLAATASAVDNAYTLMPIKIIAGTGAGSVAIITGYNGTSKVATIDRVWSVATPDATSVYRIGLAHEVIDILNQLAARFGSSAVSGNAVTFTSPDGLHVYTLTSAPNIAAPTSETLVKVA